jgi:hypothetical protein
MAIFGKSPLSDLMRCVMKHRRFMSFEVLGAASLATALAVAPLGAQVASNAAKATSSPSTKNWKLVRTPDGKPDFEGVWTNAVSTPLERPAALGTKEFYTEEEAAAIAKKGITRMRADAKPGTQADLHYDNLQFGIDRTQYVKVSGLRTSLIVGPEGRVPPVLPDVQKRLADRAALAKGHEFDGPENRGLAERCIMWPSEGPPMLAPGYNSNLKIVQGHGYVAIIEEMIHHVRMIPTDGRPHLAKEIHLWHGDSVGHWEGDTLVVDTTNFSGKIDFRGAGENLHVIERFTRTDANALLYQFTVDDPTTWTKPWSVEITMPKVDGDIYEYACQEGNYGMAGVLRGARATEKKASEEVSPK